MSATLREGIRAREAAKRPAPPPPPALPPAPPVKAKKSKPIEIPTIFEGEYEASKPDHVEYVEPDATDGAPE